MEITRRSPQGEKLGRPSIAPPEGELSRSDCGGGFRYLVRARWEAPLCHFVDISPQGGRDLRFR